jgi:hypothetical protein
MDRTLIPILNSNKDKKKIRDNMENRIPSPIKNRLENIVKHREDQVETLI